MISLVLPLRICVVVECYYFLNDNLVLVCILNINSEKQSSPYSFDRLVDCVRGDTSLNGGAALIASRLNVCLPQKLNYIKILELRVNDSQ